MTRQSRLDIAAYPQHIVQRGNNRGRIFGGDDDRRYFRQLVASAAAKHAVAVHAYVLMSNHVHLLATPAHDGGIGRLMQSVGVRYVHWFNRRYGRTGTLWEGRYRASVIEADRYLLACHRYIELNPVRAGLVTQPDAYRWSSHRANAGGAPDALLEEHAVYLALGDTPARRRAAYRELFQQPVAWLALARIRHCTEQGWALGDGGFLDRVSTLGARRAEPLPRGGDRRPDLVALSPGAR